MQERARGRSLRDGALHVLDPLAREVGRNPHPGPVLVNLILENLLGLALPLALALLWSAPAAASSSASEAAAATQTSS